MTAIFKNWRAGLTGALFLFLPFALWFHQEAHLSQASWLGLGLAGGMFALVVANAGAALLLGWSTLWMLALGVLFANGFARPEVMVAAAQTHGYVVAGVAILALAPLLFRGHAALLLLLLRVLVLICLAWWLLELSGLDPLLRAATPVLPGEDRMTAAAIDGTRGACLGSPVILAGLMGAAWPLFACRRWWPCLLPLAACLIYLNQTTGHLAALAGACAWAVAGIEAVERVYGRNWVEALVVYCILAVLVAVAIVVFLHMHKGQGDSERFALWVMIAKDARIIGYGPGSFSILTGIPTANSAYVLALFDYGWIGLAMIGLGLWQAMRRALGSPMLFAACAGIITAAAGTMIAEQAVTAAYALMLFGLVEVSREG